MSVDIYLRSATDEDVILRDPTAEDVSDVTGTGAVTFGAPTIGAIGETTDPPPWAGWGPWKPPVILWPLPIQGIGALSISHPALAGRGYIDDPIEFLM